ncbi:MAG: hypothetical protein O7G86_15565 [Gammaproteobacteria bacterium]|nr:hypothetical protein [Gammaproteobacteria bacterium]
MRSHRKQAVRPVLMVLLLLLGPLNAQTVFACMMMSGVVLESCCCDDHEPVINKLDTEHEPCCEKFVELRTDPTSDLSTFTKPVEVRSDVDPPSAVFLAINLVVQPDRVITIATSNRDNSFHHPGSRTYLVTQRLRI